MDIQKVFLILGVCLTFIITFGLFGNVLSFYIWTRGQRCSKRQGAVYLRLLALADALVLCIPAMELTVMLLEHTILSRHLNPAFCKIFPFSPYFCVQLSVWIVVSLTVEQTIAVCRPFKMNTSPSKWRQYGIVIIIAIVSFLDNIPIWLKNNWSAQEDTLDVANNSTILTFAGNESTLKNNTQGFTTLASPFKPTEHHVYMCIYDESFWLSRTCVYCPSGYYRNIAYFDPWCVQYNNCNNAIQTSKRAYKRGLTERWRKQTCKFLGGCSGSCY